MSFSLLNFVFTLLVDYRYLLLVPIVMIEGPIATIITGFLASFGLMNPYLAYPLIVVGDVLGDSLYYAFGRFGSKALLRGWGKYIGFTLERVEKLKEHFRKHAGKTLLLGKLTHFLGAGVLVAAGMAMMPFFPFVGYSILGTIPKSFLLFVVGFYFGQAYILINHYLDYAAFGMLVLVLLLFLFYYFYTHFGKKISRRVIEG